MKCVIKIYAGVLHHAYILLLTLCRVVNFVLLWYIRQLLLFFDEAVAEASCGVMSGNSSNMMHDRVATV